MTKRHPARNLMRRFSMQEDTSREAPGEIDPYAVGLSIGKRF
jgi:hypothetical protein